MQSGEGKVRERKAEGHRVTGKDEREIEEMGENMRETTGSVLPFFLNLENRFLIERVSSDFNAPFYFMDSKSTFSIMFMIWTATKKFPFDRILISIYCPI